MLSRASIALSAAACLAGYLFVYASGRADRPVRSDGFGYYVYLPSWFIFHDPTLASTAKDCCGAEYPDFSGIIRWPGTRRWVNPHPIGVALLQTPFFLAAHGLTLWSNLSPDGFSFYYQHAVGIAGLAAAIAGLIVMGRLLRRHASDVVTAATILTLVFGTNLFHYATFDSSYSHAYSFFLFAALLDLTDRWHERPTLKRSLLIGLVAGLIVLVRHTNVILWIVFPFYGVRDGSSLRAAVRRLWENRTRLALGAAVAAAAIAPQFAIYRYATGRFFVSPYPHLGFNFTDPEWWGVLLSPQKGVLFWTPILALSVVGLALARNGTRPFLLAAWIVLIVHTWIIASWQEWQFGGSYGHRGFIDVLPIAGLGFASLFDAVREKRWARGAVTAACVVLGALSLFQMLQYWHGVIPFSDTTWAQYRAFFLKWPAQP